VSAPLTPTRAVLLVARREFVTQVRSRSFVIGLLFTVLIIALAGGVGFFVASQTSGASLGLTPGTAALRPALEQAAQQQDYELELREVDDAAGRGQVGDDELDALLTGSPGSYELVGRDAVPGDLQTVVSTAAAQQTLGAALAGAGLDPAQVAAQGRVGVTTLEADDAEQGQRIAVALGGAFLLFFSLNYAAAVAGGVVEEKQSRVVELLLSTIRPGQLLAGKVIGLGAVGLLTLVLLGGIGAGAAAAAGLLTLPGAAFGMFAMVVVWYLIGFFLFAALYAAIGSTVSRQEELQTAIAPMAILLIVPFILTLNLLPNDPRNGVAAVLSFVPFFSQTVMPVRYALGVAPLWEVAVAALLALLAIVLVVRLAARIYANSVLRTGARVGLREALGGSRT
jgi:ABC-2 type transport system permease protein